MILIGRYRSPFVRRVGVTLNYYDMAFEHKPMQHTGEDIPALRKINPIGRIPALILDDGQVIVESGAILDYLDREAGAERSLTPVSGDARNRALTMLGVATGAIDKAVSCSYEVRFRPEEKRHAPWVERCEEQVRAGFTWLESQREGDWLHGNNMSQVDITTAIGWQMLGLGMKPLQDAIKAPGIQAITERLMKDKAFSDTFPTE